MSLLLARQPTFDLMSLARITAQASAYSQQQAEQYIQTVQQERKLNLAQQTAEANRRATMQQNTLERDMSARRLDLAERVEARQREESEARLVELEREANLARGVDQFRRTSYGNGGGGSSFEPDLPSVMNEDQTTQAGDVLPDVGGADPREQLGMDITETEDALRGALAAGDEVTARMLTSQLNSLKRMYYNPTVTDPTIIDSRVAKTEATRARTDGTYIENDFDEITFDDRVQAERLRAEGRGLDNEYKDATMGDRVRGAKLDSEMAEARINEIERREAAGVGTKISVSQATAIRDSVGKLQSELAKDDANRVRREKILSTRLAKTPDEAKDLVIGALESSGVIPQTLSDGERQVIQQRIEALQTSLNGDSTVGSNASAQEQKAPTQDAAGSGSGDGQKKTLDDLLR